MADVINLDGDVAKNNASNLQQTSDDFPSGTAIRQVDGNRTEPAAVSYTDRLGEVSGQIASSIEQIRAFVLSNADALTSAVASLRETDRMTADAAAQATALIDGVADEPSGGTAQTRTRNAFQK